MGGTDHPCCRYRRTITFNDDGTSDKDVDREPSAAPKDR